MCYFAGKRLLKNITGEVDKQIATLCNTLVDLRKSFLDRVTVTTEITVVQILDNINLISDHLDDLGMYLMI